MKTVCCGTFLDSLSAVSRYHEIEDQFEGQNHRQFLMQQFINSLFFHNIYKLNCIINNFHRFINFLRNCTKRVEKLLREIFLNVKDFDNNKKIKLIRNNEFRNATRHYPCHDYRCKRCRSDARHEGD